jgi:hypothetical protein
MFVAFTHKYFRNAETSFLRQMSNIEDYLPHLIVLEKSLPTRHSRHADPVFDDPFQLAVGVLLNICRAKVRHWWRNVSGEWYARRVAVETVTHLAVMLEVFGSQIEIRNII